MLRVTVRTNRIFSKTEEVWLSTLLHKSNLTQFWTEMNANSWINKHRQLIWRRVLFWRSLPLLLKHQHLRKGFVAQACVPQSLTNWKYLTCFVNLPRNNSKNSLNQSVRTCRLFGQSDAKSETRGLIDFRQPRSQPLSVNSPGIEVGLHGLWWNTLLLLAVNGLFFYGVHSASVRNAVTSYMMYLYSTWDNFTYYKKFFLAMLLKQHYVCLSACLHVVCKTAENQH